MPKRILLIPVMLVLTPLTALSQEPSENDARADSTTASGFPGKFSGNVGFVTDYTFRGISQTREKPAIQGGIDYTHPTGVYVGVWGSSIDFNDTDHASLEVDGYGGYAYSYEDWTIDGRFTYYAYAGADTVFYYNYFEVSGSLAYDFGIPKLTASVNYSPDNFGESGTAIYYALSTKIPLVYGFGLNGHVGRQTIDDELRFGLPSYTDWAAGVTYDWRGFTTSIQYVDTDLDKNQCADGCDAKGIVSVSYAF